MVRADGATLQQLVETRNAHRTVKRAYDAVGYLHKEVQDGFRVGFGYDAVGNRVLRETSAGNVTRAKYDDCDRVISGAVNDASPIQMERGELGRATREQLSVDLARRFAYVANKLLAAQTVGTSDRGYRQDIYGWIWSSCDEKTFPKRVGANW